MSSQLWKPGPAPRPDGLRQAFASAQRRRLRSALLAAAPLVLALGAVAVAPSLHPAPSSLEPITPPDRGTTAADRGASAPAVEALAGPSSTGGIGPGHAAPGADRSGARAGDVPGTSAQHETRERTESLVLTAKRTGSTRLVLRSPLHPSLEKARFTSSGSFAGVYFRSDDGSVNGGVVRLPPPPASASGSPAIVSLGDVDTLPPGGYTVYVIGENAVEVTVPLAGAERGMRATASRRARAAYDADVHEILVGEVERELRLTVPGDRSSVGIVGTEMYSEGGRASTSILTCLARHNMACSPGDKQYDSGETATVAGSGSTSLWIREGDLDVERDAVAKVGPTAATGARFGLWYFVLDL